MPPEPPEEEELHRLQLVAMPTMSAPQPQTRQYDPGDAPRRSKGTEMMGKAAHAHYHAKAILAVTH